VQRDVEPHRPAEHVDVRPAAEVEQREPRGRDVERVEPFGAVIGIDIDAQSIAPTESYQRTQGRQQRQWFV